MTATTDGAQRYDVLVVGGGPAGLSAAEAAAKAGARVAVLERRKEIGYPVHTSGGSWISDMRAIGIPALIGVVSDATGHNLPLALGLVPIALAIGAVIWTIGWRTLPPPATDASSRDSCGRCPAKRSVNERPTASALSLQTAAISRSSTGRPGSYSSTTSGQVTTAALRTKRGRRSTRKNR